MNFVAVAPAAPGDLRAYPYGGTVPTASVINYSPVPGAGLNLANGIAQPLCDNATTTCTRDFSILTDAGTTHLVVDVVGYFVKIDRQVRTSIASAQKQSMNAIPTFACSNAGGVAVTIEAVSSGQILVQGLGTVFLQHAFGTADEVDLFVGGNATDCPNNLYGQFGFASLPTTPPSGQYIQSVPLYRVFDVTPGSYTFYLNSRLFGGAANSLQHGGLTATFMPQ
jgi:hypothetical protein